MIPAWIISALPYLARYWWIGAILGALGFAGIERGVAAGWRGKAERAEAERVACATNYDALRAATAEQNEAIEKLRTRAEEAERKGTEAVVSTVRTAERERGKIRPGDTTSADELNRWLRENFSPRSF